MDTLNFNDRKKHTQKQYKNKIFYARTYRHLKANYKNMAVFYLLFALPCLFLLFTSYSYLTRIICKWSFNILLPFVPKGEFGISSGEFLPFFGEVFFLTLPNVTPSFKLIIVNIIAILLLFVVCYNVKDKAKPIAIYSTIGLLIHLVSCLFFLVKPEAFPYSITNYSELYMKQQVGIWLSFFVIASSVSGGISYSGISKFYMIFAIMAYSFVFGFLRYIVYLVFLIKASTLYMAMIFFSFGPFFDFLYLVCIYGIFMNHLTKKFDDKKGDIQWQWA